MRTVRATRAGMGAAAALLLVIGLAGTSMASPGTARAGRETAGATARPAASAAPVIQLVFTVGNLPSRCVLMIQYNRAVSSRDGQAVASSGGIGSVTLTGNAMFLTGSGDSPLSAVVRTFLVPDDTAITGTAAIPAGTTVTVTNDQNRQTICLTSGSFSIPVGTGIGLTGRRT